MLKEHTQFVCGLCRETLQSGLFCSRCGNCQYCIQTRRKALLPQFETTLFSSRTECDCTFCLIPYTRIESLKYFEVGKEEEDGVFDNISAANSSVLSDIVRKWSQKAF